MKRFDERKAKYSYSGASDAYIEGPAELSSGLAFNREGRLQERDYYMEGVANGKDITEYSDEGFIKRITHIDGKGRSDVSAESKDYPIDTAIITYGMNNPIDETRDYGDKASPDYQVQKYDLMGRQVELSFPNKGIRYESRFDAQGLEVEELSYKDNKLDSAKRFTYEMNSRGDWVKKHETFWSAKFSGLGYAPSENYYREITYYGE